MDLPVRVLLALAVAIVRFLPAEATSFKARRELWFRPEGTLEIYQVARVRVAGEAQGAMVRLSVGLMP